jgi:opacity protein-like surface antigen
MGIRRILPPVVVLMCVTALASPARAEGPALKGRWVLGLSGGMAAPTGDLTRARDYDPTADELYLKFDTGWNACSTVDYYVANQIALGADLSTGSLRSGLDQSIPAPIDDIKGKTMKVGLHGKWVIPAGGKVLPYLGVGFGMFSRKLEFSGLGETLSYSDTKAGMTTGVGLDVMLNGLVAVGVGGAYDLSLGSFEDDVNGDRVDDKFFSDWNYITFNAGVSFHFRPAK